jgi:hypothetical protein
MPDSPATKFAKKLVGKKGKYDKLLKAARSTIYQQVFLGVAKTKII